MDVLPTSKIEKKNGNKYSHHTVTVLLYKLPEEGLTYVQKGKIQYDL
jgi:hypothetical protein